MGRAAAVGADAVRRDGDRHRRIHGGAIRPRHGENGLAAASGPVIVTGATGGVGSLAVQILSARGYQVTALTGKDGEHDYLRSLGAANVLSRHGLGRGTRPLEKATWAGAVDAVGGDIVVVADHDDDV